MNQVRTKRLGGFAKMTTVALVLAAAGCDVPPDQVGALSRAVVQATNNPVVADHFSGTVDLVFTVERFGQPLGQAVPLLFSTLAGPTPGGTFVPARGGTSCSPGVDFITVNNRAISIPVGANSTSTTVTVCGDSLVEGREAVFVNFFDPATPQEPTEGETSFGFITDDPSVRFDNVSMREPIVGGRAMTFTLQTSQIMPRDISVLVSTRSGSATATTGALTNCSTFPHGDYLPVTGRLVTILANTKSADFNVDVCADSAVEQREFFTLDLSNPSNASIAVNGTVGFILDTPPLTLP